jgi:hypothetical protein
MKRAQGGARPSGVTGLRKRPPPPQNEGINPDSVNLVGTVSESVKPLFPLGWNDRIARAF